MVDSPTSFLYVYLLIFSFRMWLLGLEFLPRSFDFLQNKGFAGGPSMSIYGSYETISP